MREHITLGPCPYEEIPARLGEPNYRANVFRQCRSYIQAIRNLLGNEPEGAELGLKSFEHELGEYLEVVCYYDPKNELALHYALRCEAEGPATYAQAGMKPPKLLSSTQHGKL